MDRNIINYLPPVLQNVREYKGVMNAEQDEFSDTWDCTDDIFNAQFINDADESGLERWEKVLGITPKASATLEDRRFAIITLINESVPYTATALEQMLDTMCGTDGYSVEIDNAAYTIRVKVDLTVKNQYNSVSEMLLRVIPVNMIIDLKLKYNTHEILAAFTYAQLAAYTHTQLREDVINA